MGAAGLSGEEHFRIEGPLGPMWAYSVNGRGGIERYMDANDLPAALAQIKDNLAMPLPRPWVQLGIDSFGGYADYFAQDVPGIWAGVEDEALQAAFDEVAEFGGFGRGELPEFGLGAEDGGHGVAYRLRLEELLAGFVVKGLEMAAYDPRGSWGQGLAYAVANRGACHLSAYLIALEIYFETPPQVFFLKL